eukprot:5085373-Amphidinium_carterae.1
MGWASCVLELWPTQSEALIKGNVFKKLKPYAMAVLSNLSWNRMQVVLRSSRSGQPRTAGRSNLRKSRESSNVSNHTALIPNAEYTVV